MAAWLVLKGGADRVVYMTEGPEYDITEGSVNEMLGRFLRELPDAC
jgi:hypothetical protein